MLIEEIIFFVIVQVVTGFVVWIICNVDSDNKVNDLEKRIHSTFIKKEEQEVLNEKSKEEQDKINQQEKFFNEIMDYTEEKAKSSYKGGK